MANQYTPDSSWSTLREKIEFYLDTTSSPDGCWLWTKSKFRRGYGCVKWFGKGYRVHRAYLIELGIDVPEDMDIDHLCRNTSCSNPEHLEVVTHRENVRRGNAGKFQVVSPTCMHGHEYTPENTGNDRGKRLCRECQRTKARRRVHCEVCGQEVSASNRAAHRRRRHPETVSG